MPFDLARLSSLDPQVLVLAVGSVLVLLHLIAVLLLLFSGRPSRRDRLRFEDLMEQARRSEVDIGEELARLRAEAAENSRNLREEVVRVQVQMSELIDRRLARVAESQHQQSEGLRQAVERQLASLREENGVQLDRMRTTVDERLQGTLERRLGESFRLVTERLQAVHEGLGEVRHLANGVGDLKRLLGNVKVRGGWGEVQLGALLDQLLAPEQFERNAAVSPAGAERVDFAVRLPGRGGEEPVWLPIDAKFPLEDHQRLLQGLDAGDGEAVAAAARALEARVRLEARRIAGKYLNPPRTTDFALLFLPTESLYAEVVRRPGLVESLQHELRVVVAGPTTLAALLNSLQMGFRTLAIERRSAEVWQILTEVKTEFGRLAPALEKVRRKLQEASTSIDGAEQRQRAVERRLRSIESLPAPSAPEVDDPASDD